MKTRTILLAICALAGLAPAQSDQEALKAALSAHTGVPVDALGDVNSAVVRFKTLDIILTRAKAMDRTNGQLVSASWDQNGVARDYAALRLDELNARQANPAAKIDERLVAAMAAVDGAPLRVGAWLHSDMTAIHQFVASMRQGVDQSTPTEILQDMERTIDVFVSGRVAEATQPFVGALELRGIQPRYVSIGAPVVFFDADAAQVMELAALTTVDTIYLESLDDQDTNEDAKASHRTRRVHQMGVKGRGVRVAMLENNGIDPASPWLNVSGWFRVPEDPDDHIHGTSGCVASQHPDRGGSAPNVELFSANADSYTDADIIAAADWALTSGAAGAGGGGNPYVDVLNGSFGPTSPSGVLDMSDRYFDYRVRAGIDSVVLSAGNAGTASPVGHCGWNIICVGSFDNNDSGDWTGDTMSTFSCTADPTTGCQKPNVVAVGESVDTLGDSSGLGGAGPWLADNYAGTSFSAPFVTANLSNTMVSGVGGGTVTAWPTAGIALMMATAWNNIEGASRLSDEDGAGGINGLAAVRAARNQQLINDVVNATDFTTGTYACGGTFYARNIWLQAGDKARVCIAWLSNADSTYTTDTLDADLDLSIYEGFSVCAGVSLASSLSFNNNYEIVEFTPTTTGWHTVRINDFSFAGVSEDLSIAWSQMSADSSRSFKLREFSAESLVVGTGPVLGTNYFMNFAAPNSPGCPNVICAPGFNGGAGYNLGGGALSPLSVNLWFNLWLGQWTGGTPGIFHFWGGSFGALDAAGQYFGNFMTIPPFPDLEGLEISHVGIAREVGYPGSLKELSDVHTFKPWPAGVDLGLGDDDDSLVTLPFTFTFYGSPYTQVYVNANGNLTFGAPDTDFSESAAEMLAGQPRIAVLWDDLNPSAAGRVFVKQVTRNEREVVIEYVNVPQWGLADENTARVILRPDGSITLQYRDCDMVDGLVGISPGGGLSAAGETDLSDHGYDTGFGNEALYEVFGLTNPLDLTDPLTDWWSELRFKPQTPGSTSYRIEVDLVAN